MEEPNPSSEETSPDEPEGPRRVAFLLVGSALFVILLVVAFLVTRNESADTAGTAPGTDTTQSPLSDVDVDLGIGNQEPVPAPPFTVDSLSGGTVSLDEFAGKPLVLNFWASWCVPCRKEMPAFDTVYRSLDGQVGFVGLATQDERAPVEQFAEEIGVSYPLGYDEDGKVGQAYELFGMPATYFVDAQGTVVEGRFGELSEQELVEIITTLFPDVKQG